MKCLRCGLINPDVAQRCDCGFDFKTKTMEGTYLRQDSSQYVNDVNQHKAANTYHQWFGRFIKDPLRVGQNGRVLLMVSIPVMLSGVILGFSLFPAGLYPRFVLIAPGFLASLLLLYLLGFALFKGGSIGRVIVVFIGIAALWVSIILIRTIYR